MTNLEKNARQALKRTLKKVSDYIYKRYIMPNVRNKRATPRLTTRMLKDFQHSLSNRQYTVDRVSKNRFLVRVKFGGGTVMNRYDRSHKYKGTINLFDIYNRSKQDSTYDIKPRRAGVLVFNYKGMTIFTSIVKNRKKYEGFNLENVLKTNGKKIRAYFEDVFEEEFQPFINEEILNILEKGLSK